MRRLLLGISGVAVALLVSGDGRPIRVARVADPGSRRRLEDVIAEREYEASEAGQGLQAPNRAQGLRTYFEPTGIRVVDRTAPDAPVLTSLTLSGVGRGEELAPVLPGELVPKGARVEIRRTALTEWYENRPEGLEQGFVLHERPAGAGALSLELALGDAEPTLVGANLVLRSSSGRKLRYGDLRAADAAGRALAARFELSAPARVRLIVDDASASYPITIDPILTGAPDTVIHGYFNGTFGAFSSSLGFSVASAGDVNGDGYADVIAGAPYYDSGSGHTGAAFIFLGGPNGVASGDASGFTSVAATVLQSNQGMSAFGISVASAGDVNGDGYSDVIVGAPGNDGALTNEGAAFIFLGGPLGVASGNQTSAATALVGDQAYDPSTFLGGQIGFVVASAGDVNGDGYSDVLVGGEVYSGTTMGGVWVFLGGPSGVANAGPATAATRITLAAGEDAALTFGRSLASAGDVNGDGYDDVIVAVPSYSTGGSPTGGVFVFLGGPAGIADATTQTASTRLLGAGLGSSVASAGDVNGDGYADVIVGAASAGVGGVAYIYHGGPSGIANGSNLTASTTLTSTVATSGFGGFNAPRFLNAGGAVASAGDVNGDGYADVVVSASRYTVGGNAFVFAGGPNGVPSGTEATAFAALSNPDPAKGPSFGASLATAGDVNGDGFDDIVSGAPYYFDSAAIQGAGAVYVYLGGAAGVRTSAASANGRIDSPGGALGSSVASAGDVNGDGYSDVIVGAHFYDAGQPDEGAAFLFLGGPSGIAPLSSPATANTLLHSGQASANFAESVASAGDVNGDGYSDVIIGAPHYDAGVADEGAAFVFLGGPSGVASGTAASANATFHSGQQTSRFGWSVASAGDVNGDGRSDVIIGAPFYNTSFSLEGAAFVYHGGPGGLAGGTPANASATLRGNQTAAAFGLSVAGAGDVNGDGYSDVAVGAPLYDVPLITDGGGVGVWFGGPNGIASGTLAAAPMRIDGDNPSSLFGYSVAGAGDVNGDGFDEVIAGSPFASTNGRAYVYAGGATLPSNLNASAATTQITPTDPGFMLGASVSGAGDLNGDGFDDLAIGGAFVSTGSTPGEAWVVYGRASLPVSTQGAPLGGETTTQRFGASIASAGDVNGDGFADLVVGAPAYYVQGSSQQVGAAYLFYGNGATGHTVLPRQLRGNGSGTPVLPLGDTWRSDGFDVRMTAHHPAGRGRVRVEVQTCTPALAFGSPSCATTRSPGWQSDTPATSWPGVTVTVGGLPPSTEIHWRARVLYADATGPLPSNPAHGPWRHFLGAASAADIRTSSSTDVDLDGALDSIDDCRYRPNPGQEDASGLGVASAPDGIGDACQCGNVAGGGGVDSADVLAYRQSLANPTGTPLSASAQSRCTVLGAGTACNVVQVSAIRRGIHVPALPPVTSAAAAQVCAASHP